MSNSNDYIVTSLSAGVFQRTFTGGVTQAPFSLGLNGMMGLRHSCLPYTASPAQTQNTVFQRGWCGGTEPCFGSSSFYVKSIGGTGFYSTIQSAIDAIPTGVAISCSYEVIITDSETYSENVVLTNITTSVDNTVTLKTSDSNTPIIDAGQITNNGSSSLWIKDVSHVTVDGLRFQNWSSYASPGVSDGGLCAVLIGTQAEAVNPINNVIIKNCTMDGRLGGRYGVYVSYAAAPLTVSDITIQDCLMTGTLSENTQGRYGVYFNRARNCTVDHNTFRAQDSAAIQFYGHSSEMTGSHMITRNTINDCEERGIYVKNQESCSLFNNLIYDVGNLGGRSAIEIYDEIGGLKVYNNTIVSNDMSADMIDWDVGMSGENKWRNNLYRYGTNTGQAIYFFNAEAQTGSTSFVSDFNLFSLTDSLNDYSARCSACPGWVSWTSAADWTLASAQDGFSIQSDAAWGAGTIFTDESNNDYTLAVGSPAINAGTEEGTEEVTDDIDGNPRSGAKSIGCYRYYPL